MTRTMHDPIPENWPVQPVPDGTLAFGYNDTGGWQDYTTTCGHCGLSWDDGAGTELTPTPSGRCPFELFHRY